MSTAKDLKTAYKTVMDDHFPVDMEISFGKGGDKQTLVYEKSTWVIDGVEKGLRYGENPGQEAALYKLVNGNLQLGDVKCLQAGRFLASDMELLQSGKHPGKTNITDSDNAMNILRYFSHTPAVVIVKHNNPCGAAIGATVAEAYEKAWMADRLAAFGGAIAINREIDKATAQLIVQGYFEVVLAPEFADGVMDIFAKWKNLRVLRIQNMNRLQEYVGQRFIDIKSLMDGGLVAQWSYAPQALSADKLMPAQSIYKGQEYKIHRLPTKQELDDMVFGWLVESGITSNSVIYVKDGATVGIGTGEQDRVGVAEIARDKAYRKLADRLCWLAHKVPYNSLEDKDAKAEIDKQVEAQKGGLPGSCMVSDAFFPFRDGVDVGLSLGVKAVVQPGGSVRDFEVIQACNDVDATMMFTGERSFKH